MSSAKVTIACEHCGKPIESFRSQKRKYCSIACAAAERKLRGVPRPKRKTGSMLTCEKCGIEFYAPKRQVLAGRRYCSWNCRHASIISKPTQCLYCGGSMESVPGRRVQGRKYCSLACAGRARSERARQMDQLTGELARYRDLYGPLPNESD